jgi:drug/metabolite transporter (DMT)-like permease
MIPLPEPMTRRIFHFVAITLFVAGAILFFLGADSEERPATVPLCTAGFFCIMGSVLVFVVEWIWRKRGGKNRP